MRKKECIRNWIWKFTSNTSRAVVGLACGMILVIALTPSANAQTYSVLYTFMGGTDGAYPSLTPIRDASGNLYGGSYENGQLNCTALCGNFFKVDPSGNETTLATSISGAEGYGPSDLIFDKSGKLYGAMGFGGPGLYGYLFELSPGGKGKVLQLSGWGNSGKSAVRFRRQSVRRYAAGRGGLGMRSPGLWHHFPVHSER